MLGRAEGRRKPEVARAGGGIPLLPSPPCPKAQFPHASFPPISSATLAPTCPVTIQVSAIGPGPLIHNSSPQNAVAQSNDVTSQGSLGYWGAAGGLLGRLLPCSHLKAGLGLTGKVAPHVDVIGTRGIQ